ncbi:hypothetical protein DXG01_014248 [Tephrocybe rancida]|nr:hypothetical protein DXG01_014248 [Tephrocybe rancida]
MMWAALACLNQFVNSVVWHNNALNPAPIWCEISIRIMMGASVGLPAASLCINRRLYHIACGQNVSFTRTDKIRAILADTLIAVVFPLVFIAIQYVVQGHRFNIFEDVGCYPALFNTLPAYFLSIMWPIVIGLISVVYCGLTLRSFSRRRLEFGSFLSSNKSLTISRYFRLMALAMSDIVFTTPLAIFILWLNATATPIEPWVSWADTHFDYSRIEQVPAVVWHMNHLNVVAMEFSRWVTPVCAFIFFGFFGFADEARRHYSHIFWILVRPFGVRPATLPAKTNSNIPSIGYVVSCVRDSLRFTSDSRHFKKPLSSATSSLPPYSPPPSSIFPRSEKTSQDFMTDTSSMIHQDTYIPMTAYTSDTESLASSSFESTDTVLSPNHVKTHSLV